MFGRVELALASGALGDCLLGLERLTAQIPASGALGDCPIAEAQPARVERETSCLRFPPFPGGAV